jgi:hypothetical protein
MTFISLEKACNIFEKFKLKNDIKESISMRDCLVRNHIIRRLPLYIKNDEGYEETEDDIATITSDIFIYYDDIYYFCDKELMPQMSYIGCPCCGADYQDDEESKPIPLTAQSSEISKALRPGLYEIIGKRNNYAAAIDREEIRKAYDSSSCNFFNIFEKPHILAKWRNNPKLPLKVEMKYIGYK